MARVRRYPIEKPDIREQLNLKPAQKNCNFRGVHIRNALRRMGYILFCNTKTYATQNNSNFFVRLRYANRTYKIIFLHPTYRFFQLMHYSIRLSSIKQSTLKE